MNNTRSKGFTLIELLIFMGIFSSVILVLTDVLSAITQTRVKSEQASVVQQDGNYIASRITYDISRASAITLPAVVGASATSLNLTINGVAHIYAMNNGKLELTVNGDSQSLNHVDSTVSGTSFTRRGNGDGKDTITLQFTLTSVATGQTGQESQSYSTTVGLK